jgi:hypothetical protein
VAGRCVASPAARAHGRLGRGRPPPVGAAPTAPGGAHAHIPPSRRVAPPGTPALRCSPSSALG